MQLRTIGCGYEPSYYYRHVHKCSKNLRLCSWLSKGLGFRVFSLQAVQRKRVLQVLQLYTPYVHFEYTKPSRMKSRKFLFPLVQSQYWGRFHAVDHHEELSDCLGHPQFSTLTFAFPTFSDSRKVKPQQSSLSATQSQPKSGLLSSTRL